MSRAWTWIKRIVLGFGAVFVVAVVAVLVTIHTDFGRGLIRTQVEAKLDDMFIGGATVGRIEGSPFSTLTLRDIVIKGPDKKPAITVGTLELKVGLLGLVSKQAKLTGLKAEDVEVILKRDPDGTLQITRMLKPMPSSGWSVDLADLQLHRGHIELDTGTKQGVVNVDALTIYGAAHMPYGKALAANLSIRGSWRERAAGIGIDAVVNTNEGVVGIPSVMAMLGGVTVSGSALRIVPATPASALSIEGTVVIHAPAAAIAQLVPEVKLPADVAVAITAYSETPWTQLSVIGQVGTTPVRAMLSADLAKQRAMGVISTGELDLGMLSHGTLVGSGSGIVIFDGAMGRAGELPVASGVVTAWGKLRDAPYARVAVAFNTDGQRAATVVGVHGDAVKAMLVADVKKIGDAITLERSTLIASTSNPAVASGGKAPIRGSLNINLSASGMLTPALDVAVEGRVKGKRLRAPELGLSIASLDLAIKASHLPNQPKGKMELRIENLVRQDVQLARLEIDAANRPDGRLAVAVRTRPTHGPWIADVDALVTPPGTGDVVAIDIVRHHVRAGSGGDWRGTSGHIELGSKQFLVRDFTSAGENGEVAVSGLLDRAGSDAGDIIAVVDVTGFALENIDEKYRGTIEAHIDVARRDNKFSGTIDAKARGLATGATPLTLDADVNVQAQADKLVVAASASHATMGKASLAFDIDAPKDLANIAMWKHLHRDVIREARISLEKIDLAQVAELAGRKGELSGRVDGELKLGATTAGGRIQLRDVMAPPLRAMGVVNADLEISQTAPDELSSVLTGTLGGVGGFEATARLGSPEHLFDPAGWKALGAAVVRGATVRVDKVKIEPGLLDRLGIVTQLRGDARFSAELYEGMTSAQMALDLTNLRGTPIAEPVAASFAVAIDDKGATTSLAVRAPSAMLLEMRGTVPITLDELRQDPRSVLALPLDMTATIPNAPAPAVLDVFGRGEVIGGRINGTIKIGGTVGKPTIRAALAATGIRVPPGPRNKPIKTIEKLTLDATWDGTTGKVAIHGTQQDGSIDVVASGSPTALDQGTVSLKAKSFDLVPLLVFAPGPAGAASGRLDADVTVVGLDPINAKVLGELHLSNARIPISPSVGTLRRAKVDVIVGENQMKVAVEGRLGGGSLKLTSTIGLDGAQPTGGDAEVVLRKISPIGTVEPDIDANVQVKLTKGADKWIADVFVRNAVVKVPKARGEKLKPVGAPTDMVFLTGERVTTRTMKKELPKRPGLVVNVTLYSTYVESTELRGIIKGRVAISVDTESVGIVGTIEADRGDLDLFGRRYQVERAAVRFDGSTDPLLDMRISHDFPEVTTVTQVRGRLSKPELIMSSNPGMYSQGQLLGFLLGGEPTGDPQGGNARDAVTGAGTSIIANKIGGYMRKALPVDIDVLRYENATASSSAAVTVGTWLSRSLFVSYRRHLEARPDENAGEGEAEYWLSRRVMIEAVVGDRGFNGIDLLWRKRY